MSNFSQVVPVFSPSEVSRGIHKKNYVGSEKWDPAKIIFIVKRRGVAERFFLFFFCELNTDQEK